jgi:hypothetical protein
MHRRQGRAAWIRGGRCGGLAFRHLPQLHISGIQSGRISSQVNRRAGAAAGLLGQQRMDELLFALVHDRVRGVQRMQQEAGVLLRIEDALGSHANISN